ncbi:DnaJ domain-containing protein [Endogone sp. FLAS-F59071]|nr:DnaJ domain-containing protein [Endogone sp. FLAS-F59071]RUS22441.1 DnaJ domain-containing protein [Endogone sp. FLAS-F59071]|eukprot:RUS22440.1 DnaJ domain-containing protein [Endogone sp. FLAS-F59071]
MDVLSHWRTKNHLDPKVMLSPTATFARSIRPPLQTQHCRTYVAATASLCRHHYDTLKVPPDADKKHIKSQYYKLSKERHPDLNPGNEAAHQEFLHINEAYAILGNDITRREYDRELAVKQGFTGGGGLGFGVFTGGSGYRTTRVRPRQQATGSTSAQAQAQAEERKRAAKAGVDSTGGGSQFDFRKHYEKHYAEEERRKRARMAEAVGWDAESAEKVGDNDGVWARFWRIGFMFLGIILVSGLAQSTARMEERQTSAESEEQSSANGTGE